MATVGSLKGYFDHISKSNQKVNEESPCTNKRGSVLVRFSRGGGGSGSGGVETSGEGLPESPSSTVLFTSTSLTQQSRKSRRYSKRPDLGTLDESETDLTDLIDCLPLFDPNRNGDDTECHLNSTHTKGSCCSHSRLDESVTENTETYVGDNSDSSFGANGSTSEGNDDHRDYTESDWVDEDVLLSSSSDRLAKVLTDGTSGRPLSDFYELHDTIGEGGFAVVYSAVNKRTKGEVAVKDVNTAVLDHRTLESLKGEIAALQMLRGGPSILTLVDVFTEPDNTYIVTEFCRGGDLLDRVTEKEFFKEYEARQLCRNLFEAMDFIHSKRVAHRDIKPENILLVSRDDDTTIRIADFGYARRVQSEYSLHTLVGTTQYAAPEVLDLYSPGYDHRADMWSVGVIVYILLGGYAPFDGPEYELAKFICNGDYEFHSKYWSDVSEKAKQLITGLLKVDPNERMTAKDALKSPWINSGRMSMMATTISSP